MRKKLFFGLLGFTLLFANIFVQKAIAAPIPPSASTLRLGVNMHPLQNIYGAPNKVLPQVRLVKRIGVSIVRIDIHWAWIAPVSANAVWDQKQIKWLDAFLKNISGSNIEVLAVVTGAPCWASTDPKKICTTTLNYDGRYPPKNPQAYANFIGKLVKRYKGKIKYWEIWNEPNLPSFWKNPNPVAYTKLLKAAYPVIKAANPNAIVIGGSLAAWDTSSEYPMNTVAYLNEMYKAGAKGYFDRLSFHPYTDGSQPTWYDARWPMKSFSYSIPAIRRKMLGYGDARPIWLTEVGYTTVPLCDPAAGCWTPTLPVTEAQQSAYMVKMINMAKSWNYVETLIWYELIDMTNPLDQKMNPEYYFGLFHKNFTPKIAAKQFGTLDIQQNQGK